MASKKSNAKSKGAAPNFGAALAKAREETDHIFKRANEDSLSFIKDEAEAPNLTSATQLDGDPRSKAAAWAWYQRNSGGSNSTSNSPENVRNRALVVLKRSSRFKAEALRINASYTAEDTLAESGNRWDPGRSLFDSFELLSVAKELDKVLKEPSEPLVHPRTAPKTPKSSAKDPKLSSSRSLDSHGSLKRLSKFIPGHRVLCVSEEDIASSSPIQMSKRMSKPRDGPMKSPRKKKLGKQLSKAMQVFTYTPPPVSDEDQDYHHQHFHHHHHHHHHVVDELSTIV